MSGPPVQIRKYFGMSGFRFKGEGVARLYEFKEYELGSKKIDEDNL